MTLYEGIFGDPALRLVDVLEQCSIVPSGRLDSAPGAVTLTARQP
jgi:hypothetical protein